MDFLLSEKQRIETFLKTPILSDVEKSAFEKKKIIYKLKYELALEDLKNKYQESINTVDAKYNKKLDEKITTAKNYLIYIEKQTEYHKKKKNMKETLKKTLKDIVSEGGGEGATDASDTPLPLQST